MGITRKEVDACISELEAEVKQFHEMNRNTHPLVTAIGLLLALRPPTGKE